MTRWGKVKHPEEWQTIYAVLLDELDADGNRKKANRYFAEIVKRKSTTLVRVIIPFAWKLLDIDMPHSEWGKDNVIARGQEMTLAEAQEAAEAACLNVAAGRGQEIVLRKARGDEEALA